uniref:Uncharacterized protein n=1 Tax=Strongyloides venezuelensis TaxID=75913 RepID=A0A0K0F061_STRVS
MCKPSTINCSHTIRIYIRLIQKRLPVTTIDAIRSNKKNLDGANPLVHYFQKGRVDLDVTAAKRFFQRNIKAILTRMPSRTDREANREGLKDFFSTLLESPPGNSLSQIFESNIAKYPVTCLVTFLISL